MLALRTGWLPGELADLGPRFRDACHWALYAQTICGDEGLPSTEMPPMGAPPAARAAAMKVTGAVLKLRTLLYPEDDE